MKRVNFSFTVIGAVLLLLVAAMQTLAETLQAQQQKAKGDSKK